MENKEIEIFENEQIESTKKREPKYVDLYATLDLREMLELNGGLDK